MPSTIFTSESSYKLDRLCVRRGIKFSDLMENAGKSASIKIEKKIIPSLKGFNKKILILCGPGNNGGDGLVIAKYLLKSGYKVDISFPVLIKSKINRNLSHFDSATEIINEAIQITDKIHSPDLSNHAIINKYIINIQKDQCKETVAKMNLLMDKKISSEDKAYIQYNIWKYTASDKAKKNALKLYQDLYKSFPKYQYKNYISHLS